MNLLFLCVANSARSQLAEGLARHMAPDHWIIQSAGSIPTEVRPQAITVMAETAIDITEQWSKDIDDIDTADVDCVITLCAEESCPTVLHHAERLHWPIPDPAGFEHESSHQQIQRFRNTRDTIRSKLEVFIQERNT